jgi:PAS domain S-box-containing protein
MTPLKSRFTAYIFALVMTGIGFLLRIAITHFTGPGLATYITFYPPIMLAAVLGGLGPGLLATTLSALIVDYWLLPPQGVFSFQNPVDVVGMVLFIIMGILISVVVEFHYRSQQKQTNYTRSLIEVSLDPLVTISREGKITDANEAAAKIRGITKEKLIGTDFSNYFTEPEKAREGYRQVFTKGFISGYPLTIRSSNGKLTDVLYNASVYKDGKGNVLGVFAAARDITELKQSYAGLEKKVRERTHDLENANIAAQNVLEDLNIEKSKADIANAKDEAMLASIGEGLVAVDNNRKILVINKVAEDMFGIKASEALGKDVSKLPYLADEEGNILPLKDRPTYKAILKNTPLTGIYYFIKKDKTRFPVAINSAPINLDKKVIGVLDVFRDVTREQAIDKAKTEFVSLASHQLRTPLGITKWYLEALNSEDYFKKAPAVTRSYFNEIQKSNERLLSLVRELLSVSRIEQGRVNDVPKMTDVKKLVEEVVKQMKIISLKKDIDLTLTIKAGDIPLVNIDTLRLHEVIENLVTNALEYTKSGGKVSVSLQKIGSLISISFKDTGIGISEGDRKNLFTKFFRSEEAIKNNPAGSGLGLYVVKSYIEGWGGTILVESIYGKGSTFTITLPIKVKKTKGV